MMWIKPAVKKMPPAMEFATPRTVGLVLKDFTKKGNDDEPTDRISRAAAARLLYRVWLDEDSDIYCAINRACRFVAQ